KTAAVVLCAFLPLALLFAAPPEKAQAAPLITAFKAAMDTGGGAVEPGDLITYYVVLSNLGDTKQADDSAVNEFEDVIPQNCTYIPLSAQVARGGGSINYISSERKIVWNGAIEPGVNNSVVLLFVVRLSTSLKNGDVVENQGFVHWDSNGDGKADREDPTDDPRTPMVFNDPTRVTVGQTLQSVFAEKVAYDENGGALVPEDTLRYEIILANADPFPHKARFTDAIPSHTTFVAGSATASGEDGNPVGSISFQSAENRVVWNGDLPAVG
ncbi:MAG: hypothetical protein WHT46_10840, partial [Candidatus Geothermincolales bacterium]